MSLTKFSTASQSNTEITHSDWLKMAILLGTFNQSALYLRCIVMLKFVDVIISWPGIRAHDPISELLTIIPPHQLKIKLAVSFSKSLLYALFHFISQCKTDSLDRKIILSKFLGINLWVRKMLLKRRVDWNLYSGRAMAVDGEKLDARHLGNRQLTITTSYEYIQIGTT